MLYGFPRIRKSKRLPKSPSTLVIVHWSELCYMAYLAAREVINISIPPRVEPVNKISIYLAKKKKTKNTYTNKQRKKRRALSRLSNWPTSLKADNI